MSGFGETETEAKDVEAGASGSGAGSWNGGRDLDLGPSAGRGYEERGVPLSMNPERVGVCFA